MHVDRYAFGHLHHMVTLPKPMTKEHLLTVGLPDFAAAPEAQFDIDDFTGTRFEFNVVAAEQETKSDVHDVAEAKVELNDVAAAPKSNSTSMTSQETKSVQ